MHYQTIKRFLKKVQVQLLIFYGSPKLSLYRKIQIIKKGTKLEIIKISGYIQLLYLGEKMPAIQGGSLPAGEKYDKH